MTEYQTSAAHYLGTFPGGDVACQVCRRPGDVRVVAIVRGRALIMDLCTTHGSAVAQRLLANVSFNEGDREPPSAPAYAGSLPAHSRVDFFKA